MTEQSTVRRVGESAPSMELAGQSATAHVSRETNDLVSHGAVTSPNHDAHADIDVDVSRAPSSSGDTGSERAGAVPPARGTEAGANDVVKRDNVSRGAGHNSNGGPATVFADDSRAKGPSSGDVSRETALGDQGMAAPKGDALHSSALVDAGSAVPGGGLRGVDGIDGISNLAGSTVVQQASISSEAELAHEGDGVSRETSADDYLPIAGEAKRAVAVLNPSGRTFPSPARRRVFGVANQKGGVGKTTTAVNLAVGLALHGLRVLVIDLDPQGNASTGLDVPHQTGTPSSYDVLLDGMEIREAMVPVAGVPNLFCVPATIDLAGAEIELVSVDARERRLHKAIEDLKDEFEYIFIDCPPSLGLLTVNAMVAAREVLIPIQCEYYALEGLGQLIHNIDLVRAHLNSEVRISTILLTMYDKRTKLADQVAAEVRGHFGDKVLGAVIPRSVRVSEAPGYGQSVMTYDPGSRGATSYLEAARELAERCARDETVGAWDEE